MRFTVSIVSQKGPNKFNFKFFSEIVFSKRLEILSQGEFLILGFQVNKQTNNSGVYEWFIDET